MRILYTVFFAFLIMCVELSAFTISGWTSSAFSSPVQIDVLFENPVTFANYVQINNSLGITGNLEISGNIESAKLFPNAVGGGKYCRGAKGPIGENLEPVVYVVDTLDYDAQPPYTSLEMALQGTRNRIVKFDVSGKIIADTNMSIGGDYIEIDGASSPGGVIFQGTLHTAGYDHIYVHDVTIAPGLTSELTTENTDCVVVYESKYWYFKNCVFVWGNDENFSCYSRPDNDDYYVQYGTIQDCISAEGLANTNHPNGPVHSMGYIFNNKTYNVSLFRSLNVSNHDRNPLIGADTTIEVINFYSRPITSNIQIYGNQSTTYDGQDYYFFGVTADIVACGGYHPDAESDGYNGGSLVYIQNGIDGYESSSNIWISPENFWDGPGYSRHNPDNPWSIARIFAGSQTLVTADIAATERNHASWGVPENMIVRVTANILGYVTKNAGLTINSELTRRLFAITDGTSIDDPGEVGGYPQMVDMISPYITGNMTVSGSVNSFSGMEITGNITLNNGQIINVNDESNIVIMEIEKTLPGNNNIAIGNERNMRDGSSIENSLSIGGHNFTKVGTATDTVGIGYYALHGSSSTNYDYCVFVGAGSGGGGDGGDCDFNTVVGANAGNNLKNNRYNAIFGYEAQQVPGGQNSYYGALVAEDMAGTGNVGIGYNSMNDWPTSNNQLAIDNSNTVTPLIHGDFDNDIVTINGQLRFEVATESATVTWNSDVDTRLIFVFPDGTQYKVVAEEQ